MSNGFKPKPRLLLIGQTPPPWHGQAVATQILFDHEWADYQVDRIRMDFSEEIHEVGRFKIRKLRRLFELILETRECLARSKDNVLFYPPGSANWLPFLRDVIFLLFVRRMAARTVFIFHASGLARFTEKNWITRTLAGLAYGNADMALEVAEEHPAPHDVFHSKRHRWCPCGIKVVEMPRKSRSHEMPIEVLYVGSLQEGKGILDIIRTAAILEQRGYSADFHFNMVGKWFSPEFEEETLSLLSDLRLEKMVSFSGQLTGDLKWQAYADSDVFFFPTHYQSEASPIVLMEALGMGCPIISTEWAGIPAMLKNCKAAKLFPIGSPDLYADAFVDFKNEVNRNVDHAMHARDFYRENFLPEKFIERVKGAFGEITEDMDWYP